MSESDAPSHPANGRPRTSSSCRLSSSPAIEGDSNTVRSAHPQISVASFYGSVFPAVQNLLLACRAVGLGASLQTLPIWWVPAVRRILGLPRNIVPVCIIPIGWAKGRYGPTTRRPIGEVVHFDRLLTVAVGAVDGVAVDADGSDVAKALSA